MEAVKTPVVILSYNRLGPLRKLLETLETLQGIGSILILDNASTEPELIDWLNQADNDDPEDQYRKVLGFCPKVQFILENLGHTGVKPLLQEMFKGQRFIFTDPDLVKSPDCPDNLIQRLHQLLNRHPQLQKAGPGLVTSDLPDHYPFKKQVQEHERQLLHQWLPDGSRIAPIDTTFALYRNPEAFGDWRVPAARMSAPYMFRHPDWYVDPHNMTEEYRDYLKRCGKSASYANQLKEWLQKEGIPL